MKSELARKLVAATVVFAGAMSAVALTPERPAHALPIFTRRYGAPCQTCHTVAPKLTKMGLAFQANHLNWPGQYPPAKHEGLGAVPVSGLMTNVSSSGQGQETLTAFQTQELFVSDGFKVTSTAKGGYWLDYFAATNDNDRASDLDGAWVALPVAGKQGQLSIVGGQFQPLMYQWDAISNLSQATPAPFSNTFDNLQFDVSQPGVRLEYYDNRGKLTADGDYVNVGVPFQGHLTLNKDSDVDGPQGVYVHAFKRVGYTTAGFLYYTHDGNNYGSLIGTRHIGHYVYLLGVAAAGHDMNGTERYLSGQADFCPYSWLAVSGRYESITGDTSSAYPVATVTVYPPKINWLRLTGEAVMQPGNRSNTVYAFVQF